MTTLEQILEQGTDTEKELAKLAKSMPTKAEEKVKDEIKSYLLGTLCFGGGTAGLVSYGILENVKDTFSLFWGGMGILGTGIGTLVNSSALLDYLKIRFVYNKRNQWKEIIPESERFLFYQFNNGFTYNPTPIEVKLGQRVYPIEGLEEMDTIKEKAVVYISNVALREVSRENYESFVEIGMTDRTVEFEKINKAKVQYELRKREEVNCVDLEIVLDNKGKHYFDHFSQEGSECSLLFSVREGEIEDILRIFPSQLEK